MAECRLLIYTVPEGPPYYACGPVRSVTRCQTHNMEVSNPTTEGSLCPLGRIEKATEDALAKIEAAKAR